MTETPAAQPQNGAISTEQWQQFIQGMQAQNQALAAQLNATNAQVIDQNVKTYKENLSKLDDKQRADILQRQMDALAAAGEQAQRENLSQQVWRQRDAEAAAQLLVMHGFNGQEPELYKGEWDVNWMPRFSSSLKHAVDARAVRNQANNSQSNPANRANVGNGTSNSIPEVDEKASGYDTIRFALQKAGRG